MQTPTSETLLERETAIEFRESKALLWPFNDSINSGGEVAEENPNKFLYSNSTPLTTTSSQHLAPTGVE